jgi:hypothetical protein
LVEKVLIEKEGSECPSTWYNPSMKCGRRMRQEKLVGEVSAMW